MPDVFLSYSRKDSDFAHRLVERLKAEQRDVWVDFEDIPFATDWWQEIVAGIESANAVIFVVSPDSIQSEVCSLEVAHALKNNKKFIPIVYRDANLYHLETGTFKVPAKIRTLNWIFFTDDQRFDEAYAKLRTTLDTDLETTRELTKLLLQARDWEQKGRSTSLLLRGIELEEALRVQANPQLTALQREFLDASKTRDHVLELGTRFVWGAVGGIVGMAWVIAGIFRGFTLEDPVSLALAFTAGQFFGLFIGLLALVSYGLPQAIEKRLPRWGHLSARISIALIIGMLAWVVYQWFFLGAPFALNSTKLLGGVGLAAGFILSMLGSVPRIQQALRLKSGASWLPLLSSALIAVCSFIPIYLFNSTSGLPAIQDGSLEWLIAFDTAEQVWSVGLPLALCIALGANASALWRFVRSLRSKRSV